MNSTDEPRPGDGDAHLSSRHGRGSYRVLSPNVKQKCRRNSGGSHRLNPISILNFRLLTARSLVNSYDMLESLDPGTHQRGSGPRARPQRRGEHPDRTRTLGRPFALHARRARADAARARVAGRSDRCGVDRWSTAGDVSVQSLRWRCACGRHRRNVVPRARSATSRARRWSRSASSSTSTQPPAVAARTLVHARFGELLRDGRRPIAPGLGHRRRRAGAGHRRRRRAGRPGRAPRLGRLLDPGLVRGALRRAGARRQPRQRRWRWASTGRTGGRSSTCCT